MIILHKNVAGASEGTADEVKILILHGLLHLAGYDHEADHGEMARTEERLRNNLGLPVGLIARTAPNKTARRARRENPQRRKKLAGKSARSTLAPRRSR